MSSATDHPLLSRTSIADPGVHASPRTTWTRCRAALPGLAWTGAIAFVAVRLSRFDWLQSKGISALTLAIVLGMVAGNTVYPRISASAGPGVAVSKGNLLRLGIVLYGLRLTFQDIGNVGWTGVAIDVAVIASTFGLACLLGTRVFGLDRRTAMLIGTGSSICGAAAIMAAEPVLRARAEQVAVAVATVVIFGTVAMFLYPFMYHFNAQHHLITLSPSAYGVYAGSTIHEVAQVVAAAREVDEQAANTAVIAKMVRVMMLAPFLIMLSARLSHASQRDDDTDVPGAKRAGVAISWFAFGFVAVAGVNSLDLLPPTAVSELTTLDGALLAMAMAGLGLSTHASAVRKAGVKPLALAGVLFVWLILGGLAINTGITAMLCR